jgi:hypothetical protein
MLVILFSIKIAFHAFLRNYYHLNIASTWKSSCLLRKLSACLEILFYFFHHHPDSRVTMFYVIKIAILLLFVLDSICSVCVFV